MTEQRLLPVVPADDELVFVHYEYKLTTGARLHNVEAITVQDGRGCSDPKSTVPADR